MSEENKKKTKLKREKGFKNLFIALFVIGVIAAGVVSGIVIAIAKDAPEINPTNINSLLDQTSIILDQNDNVLEKIQTEEYRTIVSIDEMPDHLKDAFIAIEDERFEDHIGVDPIGIIKSAIENMRAGEIVRGGSTITQQLAKNLYLSTEKKFSRKIQEAYLSLQIEQELTKDQILEAYFNRIFLGQGAYGVQEAAQTYFSKDVQDLTIAESATLAGIAQSPTRYALYKSIKPENFDDKNHIEVGQVDILGEKYIAIYNERAIERQKTVLNKMLELGKISKEEYDTALNEDIKSKIKPGQKKIQGISSYFNDYIKAQAIDAMINELGYTKEQAENKLYTGGLKIYSTMDLKLQKTIEDIYDNFTEHLLGNTENINSPALISWKRDNASNIVNNNNNIIFYNKQNLLDENFNLIVEKNTFELINDNLIIKNKKLIPYNNTIDIGDYYTINDEKNLVTHRVGNLSLSEDGFTVGEDGSITISNKFINENPDFYSINEQGDLIINTKYFYRQEKGIVQPQSSTIIIDYRTGQIKALVGGRDVEGTRILNRATSSPRQPGSTIKPIAVYLPALDNGYTAATPIDDLPFYVSGKLWPNNWYTGYRGTYTLRQSVEQSVNVNSVKTVQNIGVQTSMEYLSKMGIIDATNPSNDNFITRAENNSNNDENLSALGLGGMTRGLTPLEMTAAYGSIANGGTYTEPIAFTKILDNDGEILIDHTPKQNTVVSPQTAFIMSDILRTTVSNGIAGKAQIPNMPTAGKTGTTQDKADAWFVGYTPYYVTGLWIGNDSPQIKLNQGSTMAAQLWKIVMTKVHEGLEPKNFEQPKDIITVNICTESGKLPTELCKDDPRGSTIRSEKFVRGTQPKEFCDVHVKEKIDTTTNKIASEYCPKNKVEERVFIQRNPAYKPGDNNGIVPSDYKYTVPTEICNEHDQDNWIEDWLDDLINNGPDDKKNNKNKKNKDNNGHGDNKHDDRNNRNEDDD
ncbi:PBP1A family penicillin-binding protein [Schnuerera sp. xch1]|uniref:penicillin-binding protein 1A n=1 Tax=Schnuerera sp. xch1 TaxID=2874283 RepID=UPI001CBC990D|nr:PBP1A family penicillin-binding protein [Schnuerera sp. xch1]MBZ2173639.1 PBP1A family penicillin-binding protein [Schnuerera sp. xch1]